MEPSLVESYTVSPDAKVWTMKLRKGVKFHHGTVFTADDVVYTVNRWLDKKLGMVPNGVFGRLVQKIEKVDAYTVQVHPDADRRGLQPEVPGVQYADARP